MAKWIQAATKRMEEKGTVGKFGAATRSKIAKAKKKGGKAEKEAVFAENMKKIAAKHKREKTAKRRSSKKSAKRRSAKRMAK